MTRHLIVCWLATTSLLLSAGWRPHGQAPASGERVSSLTITILSTMLADDGQQPS